MNLPQYQLLKSEALEVVFELEIDGSMECFDGHFDQQPILPGVAQIDFAVKIAQEHFNFVVDFKGLEVVKFQQVIMPPNTVCLKLKYDQGKGKLYFHYYKGEQKFSSGRVLV